jgi:hypothetical protein
MPSEGFEPAIQASTRPQSYPLGRAAIEISTSKIQLKCFYNFLKTRSSYRVENSILPRAACSRLAGEEIVSLYGP